MFQKELYAVRRIAFKISEFYQQDKAKTEGRTILYENQFTENDWKEIGKTTQKIVNTLRNGNGRPWWSVFHTEDGEIVIDEKGVFDEVQEIVPGLHIGFKAQDQIESACMRYGIEFKHKGLDHVSA